MKFRKKPVVIEAFQFKGWTGFMHYAPEWFQEHDAGYRSVGAHVFLPDHDALGPRPDVACIISTLEGEMRADINDWIIKGVNGEFNPCKPDIFAATYEPVADDAA